MSKSRGRSKTEIEHLRGQIRQLKSELKYYKRRSHIENLIIDDVIDDAELDIVETELCPSCCKNILVTYDFVYAVLRKCSCGYEEKRRKK
jgi:hypothetical protein